MKFLLYPNATRPEAMQFAGELQAWLESKGHAGIIYGEGECAECRICIVIGGDGTVLRAVRETYQHGFPYWPVNFGHLGYLTECQPDEAFSQLEKILAGDYRIEQRSTMNGFLLSGGHSRRFLAINEAVIHRGAYSRTLRVRLAIGNTEIASFSGDGLMICTPTGSTAYNLSAGGPILMPDAEELAITPICAHSSVCAPIVVSRKHRIRITVSFPEPEDETGRPGLTIDGMERYQMQPNDRIECGLCPISIGFIKTSETSFYKRLQQRLALREE